MKDMIESQRIYFNRGITKALDFRILMLNKLKACIEKSEAKIYEALKEDLNKSEYESYVTELQVVYGEINFAIKNLKGWMRPKRVKTPVTHFPASSFLYREPYGVVLILSPWNYPFQLAMAPLVGAIAAGNCVALKTSKNSKHTSRVIKEILEEAFVSQYVFSVSDEYSYEEILELKYDKICFTGSERVGKIVMEAAAKHITPVVLELGGKSPCIVDESADIKLAAKRIVWGKFLNAGQTCVAPDYVLIHSKVKDKFIKEAQKQIEIMYPNAIENEDYPRIVNEYHFERLKRIINHEEDKSGGNSNREKLKIEPTLFHHAEFTDEIMKDEIFGPILPILSYHRIDEVIELLKDRPKPLALYVFSQSHKFVKKVIYSLSFGGGCVNDVIMHLANHHLPFGGVGSSGMGNYHGLYSFESFSHTKSILMNKNYFDIPLRYAPYHIKNLKLIKMLTR